MLNGLLHTYRKLKENDAFSVLLHPRVVSNYRRYAREFRERPVVMTSHPTSVEIELTNRCNLACTQCLRSQGLRPYGLGDMSLETYRRVLAQFPYTLSLSLNGFGEPILHSSFFEIVRHSREVLPWAKIVIYSNGILVGDEPARRLGECGLTELDISIDAAEPETYRRVRRGGELAVVHDNIRRLVRAKRERGGPLPMLGMNFVMLNENEGELVRFVEQASELGVDFINCVTYASYDWGFENRRSPESYLSELDDAERRIRELGIRIKAFPSRDFSWTRPETPFRCGFFWGENFRVTYDGHVTLGCCTPFKETYSYGNVLEVPFSEIWNNEPFRRNRELARRNVPPVPACVSCDRFAKRFFELRPPERRSGASRGSPQAAR